jgi:hypothetical protein
MYSNSNCDSNSDSNYIDDTERKLTIDMINTNTTTQEQPEQQAEEPNEKPTPSYRRLTFICMNECDFCTNVQTPGPYMHYLSFVTKNGWASCANERCRQRGNDAVANFMDTKAFGRANHLKDRPIKIKRTSGQMDDDWVLEKTFPEVQLSSTGEDKVCVTKLGADLEKWVSVNNLLSWNME